MDKVIFMFAMFAMFALAGARHKTADLPGPGMGWPRNPPAHRSPDGKWFQDCHFDGTVEGGGIMSGSMKQKCTTYKVVELEEPFEMNEAGQRLRYELFSPEDLKELETEDCAPPEPAIDYVFKFKKYELPDPGESRGLYEPFTRSHDGEWFTQCLVENHNQLHHKNQCTRYKVHRLTPPYELDEFGRELIYGLVEHEILSPPKELDEFAHSGNSAIISGNP